MGMLEVVQGDCRELLSIMDPESIDAIVTDPPYELGFMGKRWDASGIAYDPNVWTEVLRVLKPGGHLLAFGGTRTSHRMVCAIEDSGFEIRDALVWLYGSGFPKGLNVSKAIDKAAGAEREVVGSYSIGGNAGIPCKEKGGTYGVGVGTAPPVDVAITKPATPEAQQWEGWGTNLKPAHEPITLARKPFKGAIVPNVLAHGTGAINVDGCRIAGDTKEFFSASGKPRSGMGHAHGYGMGEGFGGNAANPPSKLGRWPANVVLDAVAGSMLGEESRFFYCAKANRKEREQGLDTPKGERKNKHPTVKPLALMRWLVRLICPPGGIVLDPFAGSGTTGIACKLEGFDFLGFELDPEHTEIANQRIQCYDCNRSG